MKKLLLLPLVMLLMACPSDDDDTVLDPAPEQIIGKWSPTKDVYILNDGSQIEEIGEDCYNSTIIEFLADNTIDLTPFDEGDNDICVPDDSIVFEYFKWEKINDTTYRLTSKMAGEPEEVDNLQIEFVNPNTFIIKDDEDGTTLDGVEYTEYHEYYERQ